MRLWLLLMLLFLVPFAYSITPNNLYSCSNDPLTNNIACPCTTKDIFSINDGIIFLRYQQIPSPATSYEAKWFYEGTFVSTASDSLSYYGGGSGHCWSPARGITSSAFGQPSLTSLSSSLGGPYGNWRVDIYLNGHKEDSAYFTITPPASCSDGIKNQGEEDIDCGGPCAECAIDGTVTIKAMCVDDDIKIKLDGNYKYTGTTAHHCNNITKSYSARCDDYLKVEIVDMIVSETGYEDLEVAFSYNLNGKTVTNSFSKESDRTSSSSFNDVIPINSKIENLPADGKQFNICSHCIDGVKNYDETETDCGGSCGSCTVAYTAPNNDILDLLAPIGTTLSEAGQVVEPQDSTDPEGYDITIDEPQVISTPTPDYDYEYYCTNNLDGDFPYPSTQPEHYAPVNEDDDKIYHKSNWTENTECSGNDFKLCFNDPMNRYENNCNCNELIDGNKVYEEYPQFYFRYYAEPGMEYYPKSYRMYYVDDQGDEMLMSRSYLPNKVYVSTPDYYNGYYGQCYGNPIYVTNISVDPYFDIYDLCDQNDLHLNDDCPIGKWRIEFIMEGNDNDAGSSNSNRITEDVSFEVLSTPEQAAKTTISYTGELPEDIYQCVESNLDSTSSTDTTVPLSPGCNEKELMFCTNEPNIEDYCLCNKQSTFYDIDDFVGFRYYDYPSISSEQREIVLSYTPYDSGFTYHAATEDDLPLVYDMNNKFTGFCHQGKIGINDPGNIFARKTLNYFCENTIPVSTETEQCPVGEWEVKLDLGIEGQDPVIGEFDIVASQGTQVEGGYEFEVPEYVYPQSYSSVSQIQIDDPDFLINDVQYATVYTDSSGQFIWADITSSSDDNTIYLPDGSQVIIDNGESVEIHYIDGLWVVQGVQAEVILPQLDIVLPNQELLQAEEVFNGSSIIMDEYGTACVVLEERTRYELRIEGMEPFAFFLPADAEPFKLCIKKNPEQLFTLNFDTCINCGGVDLLLGMGNMNSQIEYEMPDLGHPLFTDMINSLDVNNRISLSMSPNLQEIDMIKIDNADIQEPTHTYNSYFDILERGNIRYAKVSLSEKPSPFVTYKTTNNNAVISFTEKNLKQRSSSNEVILFGEDTQQQQDMIDDLTGLYKEVK